MNCPQCEAPLNEEFGLETCRGCGVIVFIDMEGNVCIPSESSDETLQNFQTEKNKENEESENSKVGENGSHLSSSLSSEKDMKQELESYEELEFDSGPIILEDSEEFEGHTESFKDEAELLNSKEFQEKASPPPPPPSEKKTEDSSVLEKPTSAENFLDEMQLFANLGSEAFQKADYFFDITISGIDTKDTRDELIGRLDDGRLGLDSSAITKIRNGTLVLPHVPAVKAVALVHKISYLPCKVSWVMKEKFELSEPENIPENITENTTENTEELIESSESLEDHLESSEENFESGEENPREITKEHEDVGRE